MLLATRWCIAVNSTSLGGKREKGGGKRERRWFVWHGVRQPFFEEPNPTGSRPRDLQGLMRDKGGFY